MKRKLFASIAATVLALSIVGPAAAITNGTSDEGRHPYVGLVGFYSAATPSAESWLWRCSGALIAPNVLLTAAHCTAPDPTTGDTPVRAQVWFDQHIAVNPPSGYNVGGRYLGTPHVYPRYGDIDKRGNGLPSFSFGDVGVVVLDAAVPTAVVPAGAYATLPAAGVVDTLVTGARLDQVGYGVSVQVMTFPGQNPRDRWTGPRDRLYAPSQFVSGKEVVATDQLKHSSNPGGDKGGTCFGDSGGPILLAGTNVVVGVNSYGTNVNCAGVDYATRVDLTPRLDWIGTFLP